MGIVSALKFNRRSGAIISDEEFFIGGRRRVQIADNLQSLLTEEMSNELSMEAVFGGTGNISVINDVIGKIKAELDSRFRKYRTSGNIKDGFSTVEDVSRIALQVFQDFSKDKVNKKLFGLFGFTIDDFNRGYFMQGEKKVEIKDEKIADKAMDIITLKKTMKDISEIEALVIGTDPVYNFNCFDFYGGMTHLYISTSLYNTVGSGSTTTSLSFANLINSLELDERRNGVDRVFGIVELIRITNDTAIKNSEIGGYYNIIYINGEGKSHKERVLDITGDKAQLLKEIIGAYDNNLVDKDFCFSIVDKIVFGSGEFDLNEAEAAFIGNANNVNKLELFLRGYKPANGF